MLDDLRRVSRSLRGVQMFGTEQFKQTIELLSNVSHVLVIIGVLLEVKLLSSSLLNYRFAVERAINGLKLRSARQQVRRRVAKITALSLLFFAPSVYGQLAGFVLVIDSFFCWSDLEYFTRILNGELDD